MKYFTICILHKGHLSLGKFDVRLPKDAKCYLKKLDCCNCPSQWLKQNNQVFGNTVVWHLFGDKHQNLTRLKTPYYCNSKDLSSVFGN